MEITNVTDKLLVNCAVISDSVFRDAEMIDCIFEDINMSSSTFKDVNLSNVSISSSDISGLTIDGLPISELLQKHAAISEKEFLSIRRADILSDIRVIESPSVNDRQSISHGLEINPVHCYQILDARIEISNSPEGEHVGVVWGFAAKQQVTHADFDKIFAVLDDNGVTSVRFRLPSSPQISEITDWLTKRGLRNISHGVQWIASTEQERTVETPFDLRPVDSDHAEAFAKIVIENYGLQEADVLEHYIQLVNTPDHECFIAFEERTPIGTGVIFKKEESASLIYGTTLRSYRKRGLQNAMIAYRLNEAHKMGYKLACASTLGDDQSSRNLSRQGFRKAYDEFTYASTTSAVE